VKCGRRARERGLVGLFFWDFLGGPFSVFGLAVVCVLLAPHYRESVTG
jgi:hypothetical protein